MEVTIALGRCEHGRWDGHADRVDKKWVGCPGGEFLALDALVIERVEGEWPQWAVEVLDPSLTYDTRSGEELLDALAAKAT